MSNAWNWKLMFTRKVAVSPIGSIMYYAMLKCSYSRYEYNTFSENKLENLSLKLLMTLPGFVVQ